MSWRPVDCHAHSTWSDGDLAVAEVVRLGAERGVRTSIADHVTRDISRGVTSAERFAEYVADLERHDVLRAAEHCWHDALWRELPAALLRRLTHRVGSLHAIFLPGGETLHAFSSRFPRDLDADAYMDAHLDNLERFAREMPVDILAHPTLLPHALRRRPLEELWTEPREARAVAALKRAGIAFEVSNRYRPHERFVRRAHDAGVRLSLGSDGHTREQVADVAWPLALARAVGASDESLYDPSRHGSRTGWWDSPPAARDEAP
jgi:histidinol phosphatase-like PHP family hydrolase